MATRARGSRRAYSEFPTETLREFARSVAPTDDDHNRAKEHTEKEPRDFVASAAKLAPSFASPQEADGDVDEHDDELDHDSCQHEASRLKINVNGGCQASEEGQDCLLGPDLLKGACCRGRGNSSAGSLDYQREDVGGDENYFEAAKRSGIQLVNGTRGGRCRNQRTFSPRSRSCPGQPS